MRTRDLDPPDRFDRIATLDIETDGVDGRTSALAAIGVGHFAAGDEHAEVAVFTRSSTGGDEVALVERATEWLARRDPPALVTYNGSGFDLPFVRDRLAVLEAGVSLTLPGRHVDLFPPRRRAAERSGGKWPALEECLEAYGLPAAETRWEGAPLTNVRFGEELAPRYLEALAYGDEAAVAALEPTIKAYAGTDIEATIALYEADAGRRFEPSYGRD